MQQPFDLTPGTRITRKELHQRWGGRTQGGISPSRTSHRIFLFWSPAVGEQHGYFDEFRPDGCFYYTGAGQYGDQRMRDVNLALLRHRAEERPVHLFAGAGGVVEYVGELELDLEDPYYTTEAPETGGGHLRKVFVFKFRPIDATPRGPRSRLSDALTASVEDVPIENVWTEKYFVNPAAEPTEAERREQMLVRQFEGHLRRLGHDVGRLKIVPPGEHRPIFCDLYDRTDHLLVEAKGSVSRDAIRMAVGQLLDYQRFAPGGVRLAVLLPEQPRADLLDLLESAEVEPIWPDDDTYRGYSLLDAT